MAGELLDECADDVEAVLVAWLTSLRPTGIERRAGESLPFTVVTAVAGTESVDESSVEQIVSVHTLCDRGSGHAADGHVAAAAECALTHRRMLELARQLDPIELPDGRLVSIDYVEVAETQAWQPYSDTILRKVGRYRIGLTYTIQPGS